MSRSDTIANIILRVNGQEAYKTADLLRQKISQAAEAKRQLEAAHAGGETSHGPSYVYREPLQTGARP